MTAFIPWEVWRKIGPDARADLEAYWCNVRRDGNGLQFEIAAYRVAELVSQYGSAIEHKGE